MAGDWDQRYRDGETPWNTGRPSVELQSMLDEYAIAPCRALEIGCGAGVNAVYLAQRGFEVTAFDVSATAIEAARRRARDKHVDCRFLVASAIEPPDLGAPFDFVFDRGCFHVVRELDERAVVNHLKRWLAPDGRLLVLTGNANEENHEGPPRLTEDEVRAAFEITFDIVQLRAFRFDAELDSGFRPLAWSILMRHRLR